MSKILRILFFSMLQIRVFGGILKQELRSSWDGDRLAIIDMGRKLEAVPFFGGGAGSQSNRMWPGTRPICMPSFILIRPTVWPQQTNVTDRRTTVR